MCEAHAFLLENGKEKKIMENVDRVDLEGDEARLINIFGEQKILKARNRNYSSSEGKILLMPL
jgi:predicted RNA-binding protein